MIRLPLWLAAILVVRGWLAHVTLVRRRRVPIEEAKELIARRGSYAAALSGRG